MRLEIDVFAAFGDPRDAVVRDPVFLLQNAAHEYVAGRLEVGAAYTPANEVPGLADAALGVHEHEPMPKAPVRKDRDRGPRIATVARHEIGRRIEFAHVVGVVLGHGPVPVPRTVTRIGNEYNAFRLDGAIRQRTSQLVVAAGECKLKIGHSLSLTLD